MENKEKLPQSFVWWIRRLRRLLKLPKMGKDLY